MVTCQMRQQRGKVRSSMRQRAYTGQDTSVSVFAQNLKRYIATNFPTCIIAKITVDPSGDARGPQDISAERVLRQTFSGIAVVKARTNDPATRIEAVDKRLRENIMGGPSILIHPSCRILRKACISEYHYRKLKLSGRTDQYDDAPNKNHPYSDVADALQYLMLGGGEGGSVPGAPDDFAKACAARNAENLGPPGPDGRRGWNPFKDIRR